jgi:hypothetical protein
MRKLIHAVLAVAAVSVIAPGVAQARWHPHRHDYDHHYRHHVCMFHHHHRVCYWR